MGIGFCSSPDIFIDTFMHARPAHKPLQAIHDLRQVEIVLGDRYDVVIVLLVLLHPNALQAILHIEPAVSPILLGTPIRFPDFEGAFTHALLT